MQKFPVDETQLFCCCNGLYEKSGQNIPAGCTLELYIPCLSFDLKYVNFVIPEPTDDLKVSHNSPLCERNRY